jgi:hypothetical protein
MEGTGFSGKAALRCGSRDTFRERDEPWGRRYSGKKDSSAIKETQFGKVDRDRSRSHVAETREEALVLFSISVAQELQCYVPGRSLHPSQVIATRSEPRNDSREFRDDRGRQRYCNEQTHTQTV